TSRPTSPTSWPHGPGSPGSSSASVTTPRPRRWPGRASRSSRTAASWSSTSASGRGRLPPRAPRPATFPIQETRSMPSDARPLVGLAGPIDPDGHAQLATEPRVVVAEDLSPAGVGRVAAEAEGLLIRGGPRCNEDLLAGCRRLRVIGRHGVGLDTVDLEAATR